MLKYNAASLVNLLRERTGFERDALLVISEIDETTLQRIEKEKQHPKPETLKKLIKSINLPLEGFIHSLLSYQTMEVFLLCDRLTQALDIGDISIAEPILELLEELPYFNERALQQFYLSKKARLWELQGKPAELILPLIEEGMSITFKNFRLDDIVNNVLVLEESELMHTKARILTLLS